MVSLLKLLPTQVYLQLFPSKSHPHYLRLHQAYSQSMSAENIYSGTPSKQEEKLKDSIIYKMEHNLIDIPLDHYIQHNTRSSRKQDSQFLQIRYSANIFGISFFPTTIKEWNSLPPNIVSSKSLNSFQNNLIQHFNN